MKFLNQFSVKGKTMTFPLFLPDATRGVVRSLDTRDLEEAGIEGLVVNPYHLWSRPGIEVLKKRDGIKRWMNWNGWIVSDSGGFQLLSLIYREPSFGRITERGVIFSRDAHGGQKKFFLTPEKSIQIQFDLGADILICLDDCPPPQATRVENELSVRRTIEWARRCRAEYWRLVKKAKMKESQRPLLLAVIQGGQERKARERCAGELVKIGFDGYCFGGWPLDHQGKLNLEILSLTAKLIPDGVPKFALGVGDPQSIVACFKMGYNIFDCVLPTRDARHQRLYVFSEEPRKENLLRGKKIFAYLYLTRGKYADDQKPISSFCDCFTCQNYSRAYLHHLFKIGDSLAWRLATIHNLRTYTKLIEILREVKD